eukprot:PhF_6_TR20780/c0_g1_i2/m.29828
MFTEFRKKHYPFQSSPSSPAASPMYREVFRIASDYCNILHRMNERSAHPKQLPHDQLFALCCKVSIRRHFNAIYTELPATPPTTPSHSNPSMTEYMLSLLLNEVGPYPDPLAVWCHMAYELGVDIQRVREVLSSHVEECRDVRSEAPYARVFISYFAASSKGAITYACNTLMIPMMENVKRVMDHTVPQKQAGAAGDGEAMKKSNRGSGKTTTQTQPKPPAVITKEGLQEEETTHVVGVDFDNDEQFQRPVPKRPQRLFEGVIVYDMMIPMEYPD